jgi:hypothetical protein
MVNAARNRMPEIGGSANEAAARVLFELVTEENSHYDNQDVEVDDLFKALVIKFHSENSAGDVGDRFLLSMAMYQQAFLLICHVLHCHVTNIKIPDRS